jgi:hypothetical protein
MSDSAQPEIVAFRELELLVRHLADELAAFRRRALLAESRVRELEAGDAPPASDQRQQLTERCAQLEQENLLLRGRLDSASARARQMLDRVHFIRQQTQAGSER